MGEMTPQKKMATLIVGIVLILCAVGASIWWFVFFSKPNPPLPRQQITIISSSTSAGATTTSTASTTTLTRTVSSTESGVPDANRDENPPLPTEQLTVNNAVFDVEVASTILEQSRGLSNRPSLGANQGMLFVFSAPSTQAFWMKDMNFPLDMIWIGGTTIVGFSQNDPAAPGVASPPGIYFSPSSTDKVLEVNAGTVAKYNIQIGDSAEIQ
jgi:uncharacterized membrane protein (UPF0127 family)